MFPSSSMGGWVSIPESDKSTQFAIDLPSIKLCTVCSGTNSGNRLRPHAMGLKRVLQNENGVFKKLFTKLIKLFFKKCLLHYPKHLILDLFLYNLIHTARLASSNFIKKF